MRVREIMTSSAHCCGPDASLEEVARLMVECDCGMIPILDEDQKPIGAVTDRDIACRAVAKGVNPLDLTARDVMSSPCLTISPDTDIEDCIRLLEDHQMRRIVVVDGDGRCCGIATQADIARKASADKAAEMVREVSQPTQAAHAAHA